MTNYRASFSTGRHLMPTQALCCASGTAKPAENSGAECVTGTTKTVKQRQSMNHGHNRGDEMSSTGNSGEQRGNLKLFSKGVSGNPSGRPKGFAEIQAAARSHSVAALDVMVRALDSKDERLRLFAAQAILDRGYGKPAQHVTVAKSPLDDIDPATLAALAEALGIGADEPPPTLN